MPVRPLVGELVASLLATCLRATEDGSLVHTVSYLRLSWVVRYDGIGCAQHNPCEQPVATLFGITISGGQPQRDQLLWVAESG